MFYAPVSVREPPHKWICSLDINASMKYVHLFQFPPGAALRVAETVKCFSSSIQLRFITFSAFLTLICTHISTPYWAFTLCMALINPALT